MKRNLIPQTLFIQRATEFPLVSLQVAPWVIKYWKTNMRIPPLKNLVLQMASINPTDHMDSDIPFPQARGTPVNQSWHQPWDVPKWCPRGCLAGTSDKLQVIPSPGETTWHKQLHAHLSLSLGFPEDMGGEVIIFLSPGICL